MLTQGVGGERGASALIVAAAMLLLLGFAALAIDVGAGFNERRADQTAADMSAMAGVVAALNGGTAMRDEALAYVEDNLPTTYTAAEWQALWESCVDPASERNDGGYDFVALPAPATWVPTDPTNWCLSFESARGLLRVRLPMQLVDTTFGRLFGVDELATGAFAVSRLRPINGAGGILPFGISSGAGSGHLCLSSSPSGLAQDPCTGSVSGNFGSLKGRKFGNPLIPTSPECSASPPPQVLAQNIAHGYDHVIIPDADGLVANEVRDLCYNPLVDTLNTDTGFPGNGAEQGLVGPVPGGYTPRLAQSAVTTTIFGRAVDDRPLWQYISPTADYGGTSTATAADDAPASCAPSTFNGGQQDWDLDGNPDENRSWQHMEVCIAEYVAGAYSAVIFSQSLGSNAARFAYIPEFWESTLGTGSSWLHIRRFRAIYLQTTAWKSADWVFHSPGEPCVPAPCSGAHAMKQLSAFVLPDSALPQSLRGSNPPGGPGGLNPFVVELYR